MKKHSGTRVMTGDPRLRSAAPQALEGLVAEQRLVSVPADFDPATNPILGTHWFGIEPFRPIDQVASEVVADFKRQRQIKHVYSLGVRAVGEILFEVAEGEDLDRALGAYERLTPDLLKALGGDRFPPVPIHEIQR